MDIKKIEDVVAYKVLKILVGRKAIPTVKCWDLAANWYCTDSDGHIFCGPRSLNRYGGSFASNNNRFEDLTAKM